MKVKRKRKKESVSKKIVNSLNIPEDVVFDIPRMTLYDNREMRIENYKTILEYEETNIKLALKEKFLEILGEKLEITVITDDEISIKGTITSILFQ